MEVKSLPKVSVIMTSYNEVPAYLHTAIESYLTQQGVSMQLILSLVEGDKNIPAILKNFKDKLELVVVPKSEHPGRSPLGSFFQLNYALNKISGEWFSFASSNDYAYPTKFIQEIYYCMISKKKVCYSAFDYLFHKNKLLQKKTITQTQLFHEYDFEKHKTINFVSDCALLSMELGKKYFPFDLSFINYGFWDLWLRIYEGEGNVFCYNSTPTWLYRQLKTSMHIEREKNPKIKEQFLKDKERMLSTHRS